MTTPELKHSLYLHIQKWLLNTPEKDDLHWPAFYQHDNLCKQMTEAAMAVLESSVEGQEYLEQEEPRA